MKQGSLETAFPKTSVPEVALVRPPLLPSVPRRRSWERPDVRLCCTHLHARVYEVEASGLESILILDRLVGPVGR